MTSDQCEYDLTGNNDLCGRVPTYSDGLCVFHSRERDKPPSEFNDAIRTKIDADFTGFVFFATLTEEMLTDEIRGASERWRVAKDITLKKAALFGGMTFRNTVFERSIDMRECDLKGSCDLAENRFEGAVVMDGTRIHGSLNLSASQFRDTKIDNDTPAVSFQNVRITDPKRVKLHDIDLGDWSFLKTDVSGLDLRRCKWASADRCPRGRIMPANWILYDEIRPKWDYRPLLRAVTRVAAPKKTRLKRGDKAVPSYREVLDLYRGLRRNYERRLEYPEAGDFHIGEMEARRLIFWHGSGPGRATRFLQYGAMTIYRVLSGYGERYTKAALWLACLVFLAAGLFLFFGLKDAKTETDIAYHLTFPRLASDVVWGFLSDFFSRALPYSLSVATLLVRDKLYAPSNGWGQWLYLAESLLGGLLVALMILGIRRNFRR